MIIQAILSWYQQHGRKNLPWQNKSDYHVWISEIMLQQTQVIKVIDYFERFIRRFPTLKQLAQADEETVLAHWSGLGYYNRARNIHKTASICMQEYAAKLPKNLKDLMQLPGIGRTTAGAILSLGSNRPFPIMDGNVKRFYSRLFAIKAEKNSLFEKKLWEKAEALIPKDFGRNYNQALMDIGSIVCTPRNPHCENCPVQKQCKAYHRNEIELYPQKNKATRQVPQSLHLLLLIDNNKVYLEKIQTTIWKHLWFLPQLDSKNYWLKSIKKPSTPLFSIQHLLSHRKLTLNIYTSQISSLKPLAEKGQWIDLSSYQEQPHPSALVKILSHFSLHC